MRKRGLTIRCKIIVDLPLELLLYLIKHKKLTTFMNLATALIMYRNTEIRNWEHYISQEYIISSKT